MPASNDLDDLRALTSPLVVYVGSELTRAAGLPTRRELAGLLLEEASERVSDRRHRELAELIERADLRDAFTELERDLTRARFGLVVERALRVDGVELPPLARAIANLGSRLGGVVTPNLDRLLERTLQGKFVVHTRPTMNLLHRQGWLLKLHGTLPDHATWVFTREQHARVALRDPVYHEVMRAMFLAKPVLFVGTTLDDPIFDAVVDRARGLADGAPPRHWALVDRAELTPGGRSKLDEAGIAAITCDGSDERVELLSSLSPAPAGRSLPLPREATRQASRGRIRILFVSANPPDMEGLALDREQRVVREAVTRARHRDRIELEVRSAVSFVDLSRALLEGEFDILHFAGHGAPKGLMLDEGSRWLPPAELVALLDEYAHPRGPLRCVLLNSCWSTAVNQLNPRVPTFISMHGPLDDRAALAFAEGFYDGVGAGRSFDEAYREGERRARHAVPGAPFEAHLSER
ncbi:CHAT domain protein [Enhygromyxa salina]|uniref:CHAT domain protein n=1 Tax=Enhygromyxa salina TaxID=215803 RepID=A0A2S9YD74_9BACT|nr:SIR2 family protein [Enhygromyxa salina]PRQ02961.1 CHAT domain protein [Enhygromyxa salina]